MTINHMICPTCGHDFYTECAYGTCVACNTFFYASQSRTCQSNQIFNPIFNTVIKINSANVTEDEVAKTISAAIQKGIRNASK